MEKKLLAQIDFKTLKDALKPTVTPKIDLSKTDLTLGEIISALLPYLFIIAGLILFGMLIWGGFELLTSGGNPETTKKAQGRITSALIGFLIIFLAYWLTQILEVILGITIF
ncbi:MAG: hypothetical protein ACPLKP_02775 [Microgenomates group bacterium]